MTKHSTAQNIFSRCSARHSQTLLVAVKSGMTFLRGSLGTCFTSLKMFISCDPLIPLLEMYPKDITPHVHKAPDTELLSQAFFTPLKSERHPRAQG